MAVGDLSRGGQCVGEAEAVLLWIGVINGNLVADVEGAAPLDAGDQPCLFHGCQRLADGGAADPVFLAELPFTGNGGHIGHGIEFPVQLFLHLGMEKAVLFLFHLHLLPSWLYLLPILVHLSWMGKEKYDHM